MKAKLIVNCGGMFSGKSSELMRQGERFLLGKKQVIYIKPIMDTRYSENEIVSHKGNKVEAINVDVDNYRLIDIVHKHPAHVILIDEVQFFSGRIVRQIEDLLKKGYTVCCSGLDMDYTGTPFLTTAKLMAMADEVNKLKAVCYCCGEDAIFSYRTTEEKDIIELGEKDKYIPLCRGCYLKNKR